MFHPIVEEIKKLNFVERDNEAWIRRLTAERDKMSKEIREIREWFADFYRRWREYRLAPPTVKRVYSMKYARLMQLENQRSIHNSTIWRLQRTLRRIRRRQLEIYHTLTRLNALETFPTVRTEAEIAIGRRRFWLLQFATRGEAPPKITPEGELIPVSARSKHTSPYFVIIGFNDFLRGPLTVVQCLSKTDYIARFWGQIQVFRFLRGFLYQFVDTAKEIPYPPVFCLPDGIFTTPDADVPWALHTAGSFMVMYEWMGRTKLGLVTVSDLSRKRIYFRDHPEVAEKIRTGIRAYYPKISE
jgi:prefoldin subunit 5